MVKNRPGVKTIFKHIYVSGERGETGFHKKRHPQRDLFYG